MPWRIFLIDFESIVWDRPLTRCSTLSQCHVFKHYTASHLGAWWRTYQYRTPLRGFCMQKRVPLTAHKRSQKKLKPGVMMFTKMASLLLDLIIVFLWLIWSNKTSLYLNPNKKNWKNDHLQTKCDSSLADGLHGPHRGHVGDQNLLWRVDDSEWDHDWEVSSTAAVTACD